MYTSPAESQSFLEPVHSHDPTSVIGLIEPPTALLRLLSDQCLCILEGLQDATSIAYSSKLRFEELIADRFDRLLPDDLTNSMFDDKEDFYTSQAVEHVKTGSVSSRRSSFSEPGFFGYQNQVKNEKRYLVQEALVDLHLKLSRLERYVRMLDLTKADDRMFYSWLDPLKREVSSWEDAAAETEVPDFEGTIAELAGTDPGLFITVSSDSESKASSVSMSRTDSGIFMQ